MNIRFFCCAQTLSKRGERERERECPDSIVQRLALSNEKAIDDRGSFNGFLL